MRINAFVRLASLFASVATTSLRASDEDSCGYIDITGSSSESTEGPEAFKDSQRGPSDPPITEMELYETVLSLGQSVVGRRAEEEFFVGGLILSGMKRAGSKPLLDTTKGIDDFVKSWSKYKARVDRSPRLDKGLLQLGYFMEAFGMRKFKQLFKGISVERAAKLVNQKSSTISLNRLAKRCKIPISIVEQALPWKKKPVVPETSIDDFINRWPNIKKAERTLSTLPSRKNQLLREELVLGYFMEAIQLGTFKKLFKDLTFESAKRMIDEQNTRLLMLAAKRNGVAWELVERFLPWSKERAELFKWTC